MEFGSHSAEDDRLMMNGIVSASGVIGPNDLKVLPTSPASFQVRVQTGGAFILGTGKPNQGMYHVFNDADTLVTVGAPGANPRTDFLFLVVRDSEVSGTFNDVSLQWVQSGTGLPAAVAPPSSILLAAVTVLVGATTINSANISSIASSQVAVGGISTTVRPITALGVSSIRLPAPDTAAPTAPAFAIYDSTGLQVLTVPSGTNSVQTYGLYATNNVEARAGLIGVTGSGNFGVRVTANLANADSVVQFTNYSQNTQRAAISVNSLLDMYIVPQRNLYLQPLGGLARVLGNLSASGLVSADSGIVGTTGASGFGVRVAAISGNGDAIFQFTNDAQNTQRGIIRMTNALDMYVTPQRNLYLNPAARYTQIDGDLYVSGAITSPSKRELKDKIAPTRYGLDAVRALSPVDFVYKETPEIPRTGFIAEEVDPVYPEGVVYEESGTPSGINLMQFIPVLVSGLQELAATVDELKKQRGSEDTCTRN